ncbi:MAG TPA: isoprenyl transferase [Sphingobacterium sp.]|nr:isoprenyl transferase [Sphingobacterium sp.]
MVLLAKTAYGGDKNKRIMIEDIDKNKIPKHIAIIMDGNGRWAKKKRKLRFFGHKKGVDSVREALEGCIELGVSYLTLYAFSSENWSRPKLEINALMELLVTSLNKELDTFQKNDVRLNTIGHIYDLPSNCQKKLEETKKLTAKNKTCTLTLALSYGSRNEILNATKKIIDKIENNEIAKSSITEDVFNQYLDTANLPDPDLLIRTGGEQRVSNFLLWQLAYTEFVFVEKMWPDFNRQDLYDSVLEFQNRERRFGKISEQL